MKTIAERLKEGMEIRKMKQADLVQLTGISKGALSSYLSGRYAPKQDNIFKLAAALNVSEAWLMGADVPMQRNPLKEPLPRERHTAAELFPKDALEALNGTDEEEQDDLMKYLELLHKNPQYRSLLDSTAKLDKEALDNLVKFIKTLTPTE